MDKDAGSFKFARSLATVIAEDGSGVEETPESGVGDRVSSGVGDAVPVVLFPHAERTRASREIRMMPVTVFNFKVNLRL